MTAYDVTVERDGHFWMIYAPVVDRWTQARHLREVETMACDLIATMLDVAPSSVAVDVEYALPPSVQKHIDEARRLREAASRANREAALESRAAAHELADADVTLRDIGQVLGVSHQRAHQLVNS